MNHGRCENCWWYYQVHGNGFKVEQGLLMETIGSGVCYMHSHCGFGSIDVVKVAANSYCPDYFNRKRKKQTLLEWIKKGNLSTDFGNFDELRCT